MVCHKAGNSSAKPMCVPGFVMGRKGAVSARYAMLKYLKLQEDIVYVLQKQL